MSPITVRQAVLADLEELVLLFDSYRQFYGRSEDLSAARDFLRDRFEHGESVLFMAHDSTGALGFAQLYPGFSSVSLCRSFVLNDVFVCERARRHGIGALLLAAAAGYARTLGALRLTLSTATENLRAQAMYQSAGWRRDEQFFVYHLALL